MKCRPVWQASYGRHTVARKDKFTGSYSIVILRVLLLSGLRTFRISVVGGVSKK